MEFTNFLKKLFGNKSDRDLREIRPIVDQINKIYRNWLRCRTTNSERALMP